MAALAGALVCTSVCDLHFRSKGRCKPLQRVEPCWRRRQSAWREKCRFGKIRNEMLHCNDETQLGPEPQLTKGLSSRTQTVLEVFSETAKINLKKTILSFSILYNMWNHDEVTVYEWRSFINPYFHLLILCPAGKNAKVVGPAFWNKNQTISKMKWLHFNRTATVHTLIYITFRLKYFSNLRRPMATHCSHWLGRLLSSLMTWNEPSGLSPPCILCVHRNADVSIEEERIKTLNRNAACLHVVPVALLQVTGGSARTSCTWRACGQKHFQTKHSKRTKFYYHSA